MAEILKPDLCIIGAGSGGLSVAAAAAALGVSVVLVEKARMGGDCLNYGCVPSKALIAGAMRAAAIARAAKFGVTAGSPKVDFSAVRDHVRGVIAAIAPNDSKARFTGLGVRVIEGAARFADRETVAVDGITIAARRFVIATGSSPRIPPIPGLADVPYLTNETVFDLAACPEHLLVIGAGPAGLELAQAFRRLGADVAVLEAALPLAQDDPECAAVVLDALARDGVAIRAGIAIKEIRQEAGRILAVVQAGGAEETISGTHLLVAAGRQPNGADLDLEDARIRSDHGRIIVDRRLRTTNRRVYAIGDVVGGRFTHVANYHAGLVVRHALFRLPVNVDYSAVPWVTYTDPELAHVGLGEAEARNRGYAIRVLRWPYGENDRAEAERERRGHIKVVTTPRGRILGATIVGAQARELIAVWALAIKQKLDVRTFAELVVPYPTLGEIGKRAAMTYYARKLTSRTVQRILRWLRRLG